jgi:hypothetical protein
MKTSVFFRLNSLGAPNYLPPSPSSHAPPLPLGLSSRLRVNNRQDDRHFGLSNCRIPTSDRHRTHQQPSLLSMCTAQTWQNDIELWDLVQMWNRVWVLGRTASHGSITNPEVQFFLQRKRSIIFSRRQKPGKKTTPWIAKKPFQNVAYICHILSKKKPIYI